MAKFAENTQMVKSRSVLKKDLRAVLDDPELKAYGNNLIKQRRATEALRRPRVQR